MQPSVSLLHPLLSVVSTPAFPLLDHPGLLWSTPACGRGSCVVCGYNSCAVFSDLERSPSWFIFLVFHSTDILKNPGPFGTVPPTLFASSELDWGNILAENRTSGLSSAPQRRPLPISDASSGPLLGLCLCFSVMSGDSGADTEFVSRIFPGMVASVTNHPSLQVCQLARWLAHLVLSLPQAWDQRFLRGALVPFSRERCSETTAWVPAGLGPLECRCPCHQPPW